MNILRSLSDTEGPLNTIQSLHRLFLRLYVLHDNVLRSVDVYATALVVVVIPVGSRY